MTWQTLILIHTVLSAGGIMLKRDLARHRVAAKAPFMVTALSNCVGGAVGIVFGLILGDIQFGVIFGPLGWHFIAGGLIFALSSISVYLSYVHLDTVVASILNTLSVFITIALAWVFLGETLTAGQIIGGAIVMPAIVTMLYLSRHHERRRRKNNNWLIGTVFSVLAAFSLAIAITNEKYLLTHVSVSTYMFYGWTLMALAAGAVAVFRPSEYKLLRNKRLVRKSLLVGAVSCGAGTFFILALANGGNVGLMSLISNCRIVLIALLAYRLLHERQDYWQRVCAAFVVVLGLSFIFW